jgi:phage gp45-like
MPVRTGFGELASRMFQQVSRGTMVKADDNRLWQEGRVRARFDRQYDKVETWSPFGFTSVPAAQGDNDKEVPETLLLFPNGSRSHPIALLMGDRRNRPRGLKPGESFQYDDLGQGYLIRRAFSALLSLDTAASGDQPAVQRFASLRHVNKSQQPRPKTGGSASAQQTENQQQQDFKHEGDSVNTEVRCTKDKIEFRVGSTVVAYIQSGKFVVNVDTYFGEDATKPMEVQAASGDAYADVTGHKVLAKPGSPAV